DNLELGNIGDEVDYWFFMHIGQFGSPHNMKYAFDNFVLKNIEDVVFPNCDISSDEADTTGLSPFTVSINFKEAVTGFDVGDIVIGNGTASNVQETGISTIWTVEITPAGDGEVTLDVAAGAVTDAAGNVNYPGAFSIVYDENYVGVVENLSAFDYAIYPNPSDGHVNLKMSNPGNHAISLSVIDISGRSVWQKQVRGLQINETIDLTGVGKGYYILCVSGGHANVYQKIVLK
ncbi:MAG: Ig-like domain-containing protein, partial [Bacteroidota bacterium]